MKCPNCQTDLKISDKFADEQVLHFSIKYEGDMLSARTVHGTLAQVEKLLIATGKDIGVKTRVYVHSIKQEPHELTFALLVVGDANPASPRYRSQTPDSKQSMTEYPDAPLSSPASAHPPCEPCG